jgi:hypothetical protein
MTPDPASGLPVSSPQAASDGERDQRCNKDKAAGKAAGTGSPQLAGMLWFAGWLFTVGFAKLVWWKAILGVVVWPYFLGTTFR